MELRIAFSIHVSILFLFVFPLLSFESTITTMKRSAPLLLLLVIALASCSTIAAEYSPFEFGTLDDSVFERVERENYYRAGSYANLVAADKTVAPDFHSIFNGASSAGVAHYSIKAVGKKSMLVIAVDFEDHKGTADLMNDIRKAFIGSDACNSYRSVASYYEKASYGRFQLESVIAPSYFRCPYDYATLASQSSPSRNKATLTDIYNKALAWYQGIEPTKYQALLSSADFGKIPVSFVYTAPYSGYAGGTSNRDSMLWAFTINTPAPISWSSSYMMHTDSGAVDAHTFIHETGHLLGLKDYYDTSASSTSYSALSPLGRIDMMDCSLGDECSYSKMLLDWARPYVPTGDCEISIRPFSSHGDFILLAPRWNGTPYDEYILLEYYVPAGLNGPDAMLRDNDAMRLPRKSGVKAYKVNSRLGVYRSGLREEMLSASTNIGTRRLDVAYDNSSRNNTLIQLLDKSSGSSALCDYYVASDTVKEVAEGGVTLRLRDSLFQKGDGFNGISFKDLRFSDGSELPFHWKVKEVTATYATISIEAI